MVTQKLSSITDNYANTQGNGTVAINANKGTFSGTIAATNIDLRGGEGHYRYERECIINCVSKTPAV